MATNFEAKASLSENQGKERSLVATYVFGPQQFALSSALLARQQMYIIYSDGEITKITHNSASFRLERLSLVSLKDKSQLKH